MKKLILVLAIALVAVACGGGPLKELRVKAEEFAKPDRKIDAKEYATLQRIVTEAPKDGEMKQFWGEGGEVDHAKVRDYLVKYLKAKKIEIGPDDIEIPETKAAAFALDVYIENSASMDGYVNGVTGFETAIYKMLADFKVKDFCQSLNLNYINRTITYTKSNAQSPDVQDFIEKLEPNVFQQRGGDRGVSDISALIRTVTEKVNDQNAVMLVSDFVFSPGKGRDADEYLNNQSVGIQIALSEKLKSTDLSVIVLQLESEFRGTYYDRNNRAIRLTDVKRPYYVWFIGTNEQIKTILGSKILDSIKGGYKNRTVFSSARSAKPLDYKILMRPRIGEFELVGGTKGSLSGTKIGRDRDGKNRFEFSVAVNFANEIQGNEFFTNKANYRVNDEAYSLDAALADPNDKSLEGFTHVIKLSTENLKAQTLKIEILGSLPFWVEQFSSDDDTAILTDDSEKTKTFGLSHLIDGIRNAFFPQGQATTNSLTITIDK